MEDQKLDDEVKVETAGEVQKQELSQTESTVTKIMTVGGDEPRPGQNTTISTVSLRTSTAQEQPAAKTVRVHIEYPKNWKRPKHLTDGQTYVVSPESAEQFVKEGFATLIKETKSE